MVRRRQAKPQPILQQRSSATIAIARPPGSPRFLAIRRRPIRAITAPVLIVSTATRQTRKPLRGSLARTNRIARHVMQMISSRVRTRSMKIRISNIRSASFVIARAHVISTQTARSARSRNAEVTSTDHRMATFDGRGAQTTAPVIEHFRDRHINVWQCRNWRGARSVRPRPCAVARACQ